MPSVYDETTAEQRKEIFAKNEDKLPAEMSEEDKTRLAGPSAQAPAVTSALGDGAAPNQAVTEQDTCGICGKPVKAGDRVTTETIFPAAGTAPYRRLVHVECQVKRAEDGRVGDPETDAVEAKVSDTELEKKKVEVSRKSLSRSDHDAMGDNPRKNDESDPYDVSKVGKDSKTPANNESQYNQ